MCSRCQLAMVQCKEKVTIVSRQVREPSHNSLCRQFSTKQSRSTQAFVEVHEAIHS